MFSNLPTRTVAFLALTLSAYGWSNNNNIAPITHRTRANNNHPHSTTSLHMGSSERNYERKQNRQRATVDDALDSINAPPSFPHSVDPTDLPPGPVHDDPLTPFIHTIVHAADMRKASNIVALRVTSCTSLTNFVVIVSGTSRPQNQAIAAAIAKDVADAEVDGDGVGRRCLGKGVPEGTADSGWILLDYGEVMVHVMTPKSRLFYDLEGQWRERGGEEMDISDILLEDGPSMGMMSEDMAEDDENEDEDWSSSTTKKPTMKERLDVEKEIDPFWS